jgi:hypothetical protein
MVAHPIVVIGDGVVHIPEQLRSDPRFQDGAALELVPVGFDGARNVSSDAPRGNWRRLRGVFKDVGVDLNDELNKERIAELAADERNLNGKPIGG